MMNDISFPMQIKATRELGDATVRLLNSRFIGDIGADGNLAYVRSWISTTGVTAAVEVVRIEEETVLALRAYSDGKAIWGPIRGRPSETVTALLQLEAPITGFDTMPGGWWWGPPTPRQYTDGERTGDEQLHAAFPNGPMPATSTALCATIMICQGYNRPSRRNIVLCP
jgi:hypothetical protein